MSQVFHPSEVIDIVDETPGVKRFFIRVPGPFDFTPGQFVMLDLPIEAKFTKRAYSIASPPSKDSVVELVIAYKNDGLATNYLFHEIKKGSTLQLAGPQGKFVMRTHTNPAADICFICTGTGIAPFRAMLLDLHLRQVPYENVRLIFGARLTGDILYRQEMENLQQHLRGFQFIPVLSREQDPSWKGEKGYVHQVYKKLYAGAPPAEFYLCGWKEMIKEAATNLQEMGYDKGHIHFEVYG